MSQRSTEGLVHNETLYSDFLTTDESHLQTVCVIDETEHVCVCEMDRDVLISLSSVCMWSKLNRNDVLMTALLLL